ncbi:hypothetical protein L3Q82_016319 [Scortum barcoo]|uniref:Uncharacterized protein n=1 Tax=Scortum barcoo TaxID=214431 RepID=A0ACB8VQZ5_9TELE|nr:hypothetical protein L3Q82_016319 [Scortum barcoo]
MFKHKGVHQCTWHQDTLGRRSMIDFVVVSSDLRPYVLDTQVKRGAELSSPDHHLVIPREAGDIESEWTMFSASIVDAAVRSCGRKVSGACRGGNPLWGELLTSTGDIVGRWKKYFEDLLNPTDLPSNEEAEAGDSEVDSSITQAEVTEDSLQAPRWQGGPESVFQLQRGSHFSASPGRSRKVFQACPTGRRPRGRPRTRWRDYVSRLAWERLFGVPPEELEEVSGAFGFINLILWVGNLWFVFKETGIIAPFMRAPPPQEKPAAPDAYGQQGAYEQDPYASNQGGYQPDYSQQGYNQKPKDVSQFFVT